MAGRGGGGSGYLMSEILKFYGVWVAGVESGNDTLVILHLVF